MADPRPVRLRLSRARGFDLQAHSRAANGLPAVHVARPGPWGNPFVVGEDGNRARCVALYTGLLGGLLCISCDAPHHAQAAAVDHARQHLPALRGHNLACWCSLDGPCHADVLLELANA